MTILKIIQNNLTNKIINLLISSIFSTIELIYISSKMIKTYNKKIKLNSFQKGNYYENSPNYFNHDRNIFYFY